MKITKIIKIIKHRMFSPRGKDMLVFCAFLGLSAVLWTVMTLDEEVQRDVRCRLEIVNCPDSVVRVSQIPEAINISVKAHGTQLMSYNIGRNPTISIDYKYYVRNGVVNLSSAEMRNLAHKLFGQSAQITAINPDSLNLVFTSRRPERMPLRVDSRINTLPNCALTGPVKAAIDSVLVYSVNGTPNDVRYISTVPVRLDDVSKSEVIRVRIQSPRGCRVVPDSVDLRINVEPMISRAVKVPIKAINVPSHTKLILVPGQIDVNYMLPMSRYDESTPQFTVVADYNTLDSNFSSNRIKVRIARAEGNFINVYLATDSVEYMIERK
jgi:hypothetical protein